MMFELCIAAVSDISNVIGLLPKLGQVDAATSRMVLKGPGESAARVGWDVNDLGCK